MKRIMVFLLLAFSMFFVSCEKKDDVDLSNINEELFDIKFYEPTQCDFKGFYLQNYLKYVDILNSQVDGLYLDVVLSDIKAGANQSVSYIDGVYDISSGGAQYKISDEKLARYSGSDLVFEYELKDSNKLFKIYNNNQAIFEYSENDNDISIVISEGNNDSILLEKGENQIIISKVYDYNFYKVKREIYSNTGKFVRFDAELMEVEYDLYPLSYFNLSIKEVNHDRYLSDSNGKLYYTYKYKDDLGMEYLYNLCEYSAITTKDVLLVEKNKNLMDILVEYKKPVTDSGATEGLLYLKDELKDEYYLAEPHSTDETNIIVASVYNNLPVTYIGEGLDIFGAYYSGYSNLNQKFKVTLPSSIKEIKKIAFARATNLTEINLSEGLEEIGEYAFTLCDSLTTITLPKSIKTLGHSIFAECRQIKEISYTGTMAEWEAISKEGWNSKSLIELVKCSDGNIAIND